MDTIKEIEIQYHNYIYINGKLPNFLFLGSQEFWNLIRYHENTLNAKISRGETQRYRGAEIVEVKKDNYIKFTD